MSVSDKGRGSTGLFAWSKICHRLKVSSFRYYILRKKISLKCFSLSEVIISQNRTDGTQRYILSVMLLAGMIQTLHGLIVVMAYRQKKTCNGKQVNGYGNMFFNGNQLCM